MGKSLYGKFRIDEKSYQEKYVLGKMIGEEPFRRSRAIRYDRKPLRRHTRQIRGTFHNFRFKHYPKITFVRRTDPKPKTIMIVLSPNALKIPAEDARIMSHTG